MKQAFTALFFSAALAVSPVSAQRIGPELERRAALGIGMDPSAQTGKGAVVTDVMPGGTAARLGLRPGDIVIRAGESEVQSSAGMMTYAASLRAGDNVKLVVLRNGRQLRIAGKALPRPLETYPTAMSDYGAVPFRGGHLRDILLTPKNAAPNYPVLFLLPGFSCVSIEPPTEGHPYRKLGELLTGRGIGYYRVEKPGMGDSAGGVDCKTIDYQTELDAFRSGYRHLVDERGISPDRIFMYGHSLGGLQAPMLAAELAPRGVAVFGTVLRNWADYHRDLAQFQSFLLAGEDPVEATAKAEKLRSVIRGFHLEGLPPKTLVERDPEAAAALREYFGWNGGELMYGRHYRFNQSLAKQPVVAAWRDTTSNVLAIYGASDLIALFDEDHRLIAEIANHYRPGTGRYVELPSTGHGMDVIGTRSEVREKTRSSGAPPQGPFNPAVAEVLADWIVASMAKPPVDAAPAQPRTS